MIKPTIWTVGHSTHSLEVFFELLVAHSIKAICDIRTTPKSKWAPQFNIENLKNLLPQKDISYFYLGQSLGGRPENVEFYDNRGFCLYSKVAESSLFQVGLEKVVVASENVNLALMCAEEDPVTCHRHLLVGRVLGDSGRLINHIRADGTIENYTQVELRRCGPQKDLFGSSSPPPWKSLKPIRSLSK